jgi:hypothetical protein
MSNLSHFAPWRLVTFVLLTMPGCVGAMDLGNFDDSGWSWDSGEGPPDESDDTNDLDNVEPAWWTLDASVLMEDGAPVQGDTSLLISLIDELADTTEPICQASFDEWPLTVLDLPDPAIFHWWSAELSKAQGDCSAHLLQSVPDSIELGIGSLHPDIAALLEPAGYDEVASYLYGAYLRVEGSEEIWTYGVAATAAGFAAEQLPVEQAPVPNGTYSLVPIYLLPLQGG